MSEQADKYFFYEGDPVIMTFASHEENMERINAANLSDEERQRNLDLLKKLEASPERNRTAEHFKRLEENSMEKTA